jgi:hypothetical protein
MTLAESTFGTPKMEAITSCQKDSIHHCVTTLFHGVQTL